jgi:hypothetical protein
MNQAPRPVVRLLEYVLPGRHGEAMLGDLVEEYRIMLRSDPRHLARRWYVSQLLQSVPRLAWSSVASGRWYNSLGIAIAVFIVIAMLESLVQRHFIAPLPFGPLACTLITIVAGLGILAFGGYLAARIELAAAILFTAVQLVAGVGLAATQPGGFPLWGHIGFFVLCPFACLGGGLICVRQSRRKARGPAR